MSTRRDIFPYLKKNGYGAEIGVFKGDFTAELLKYTTPQLLYAIDPYINLSSKDYAQTWYHENSSFDMQKIYEAVCKRFSSEIALGNLKLLRERSIDGLESLDRDSLDWAYIDGDHHYEAVAADLQACFRVVKVGGIIACDDHALGSWWEDGIVRAVNQFLGKYSDSAMIVYAKGTQVLIKKIKVTQD